MVERRTRNSGRSGNTGFTLVELIVTIVLIGALAGIASVFIVQPFEATRDLERRAELVDAADQALDRVKRDARRALPASIRVDSNRVEFVSLRTAGRYREGNEENDEHCCFDGSDDGSFEVLGRLINADGVETGATQLDDCATGEGDCISIFNTTSTDIYQDQNNIAWIVDGRTAPEDDPPVIEYDTGEDDGTGFEPDISTESQRVYVFHTVTSYICEENALYRYTDYGFVENQPEGDDLDNSNRALVARNVTSCEFRHDPGTGTRRGLLTFDIELESGGESVNLLDQAQAPNAP